MDISIKEFLEEMKNIQTNILDFLDHGSNMEEEFNDLVNNFDDFKIHDNQFKIKSLLYLLLKISNNHHRESDFFSKIAKILQLFTDDMKKYFSNNELFHIFKSNKRLLLYLLEENIMIMDESIVKKIVYNKKYINSKYPQYFQPEILPFIKEKWFPKYNMKFRSNEWVEYLKKELPDDFYEKRKIGENDDEICKLIQKDLIGEFITYVNRNSYPLKFTIKPSIYETNNFLLKKWNIALIEYAAFFGSTQIFNYLRQNGAELKTSLWIYAVHGQNPEIIMLLEENKILPFKNIEEEEEEEEEKGGEGDNKISFEQIFYESIECHHNDVANYIQVNYFSNDEKEYSKNTLINGLKYYNFMFIQCDIDNETLFIYSCKYDYYLLVLYYS